MTIAAAAVVGWLVFYFGIYLGFGNWQVRGHQEFAKNGLSQISPAAEMEEIFEDCRHYIVYTGKESVSTWNATAFFGGRYKLTMQVPVRIDSETSGSTISEPTFHLNEVESVSVSKSEQVSVSFSRAFDFDAADWNAVYERGGDFGVIDIEINPEPVAQFDRFVENSRPSN